MFNSNQIKLIFSFFLKKLIRSKKTRFFLIFSLLPLAVYLIINGIKLLNQDELLQGSSFFRFGGLLFFFQLYIPLISLLFGAAVISDEVDNKTLIYLNASPATKISVITGKFISYLTVSFLSFLTGSALLFIVTHFRTILSAEQISVLLRLELTGLMGMITYSSLFLLIGVSLKKSTILGLVYIFGWERIAEILPGTAQKLTVFFYLESLTPIHIPKERGILSFSVIQPGYAEALITLLAVSVLFFAISAYIFKNKEYLLADHT